MANEEPGKSGWGGHRKGAGRKTTDRMVDLHIRISREAADKLRKIRNRAQWLDELIRNNA